MGVYNDIFARGKQPEGENGMKLSDCKTLDDLKAFCKGHNTFYYIDWDEIRVEARDNVHFVAGRKNDRFLWGTDDSIHYDGTCFDVSHVNNEDNYMELYNDRKDPGILGWEKKLKKRKVSELQSDMKRLKKQMKELQDD